MNIGLLTPYYPDKETVDSGLASHFSTLANSLKKNGHNVTVIHVRAKYKDESSGFDSHQIDGINILTYKISLPGVLNKVFEKKWAIANFMVKLAAMLFIFKILNNIIKAYQLHVIETTSYFSLAYFYSLKKPAIPIVVRVSTTFSQIMDEYYPFKSRLLNLLGSMEINFIRKSNFLITHAYNHALELEQLYEINAREFTIIPHGVNLPPDVPVFKKSDTIRILFVGRMEYRKGIDTLLAAIPLVLNEYKNAIFELVGADVDDKHQQEFRAQNHEATNQKVLFQGSLTPAQKQSAYAGCDIFVAPSRYESFGLIYIEAMSYGKPVIGCNVGGVPEIIEDGKNGLFAQVENVQSLAQQILVLINDPIKRQQMGVYALETVKQKFTADKLASNSVKYYKQAIADFS